MFSQFYFISGLNKSLSKSPCMSCFLKQKRIKTHLTEVAPEYYHFVSPEFTLEPRRPKKEAQCVDLFSHFSQHSCNFSITSRHLSGLKSFFFRHV
eukprot:c16804_g1_i1 orf=589-873(-)